MARISNILGVYFMSTVVIQVRSAKVEDAAAIAEVHVASWCTAYRNLMPEAILSALSVAEREAHWGESIAKGEPQILVAEDGGEVIGFLAFGPSRDEGASPDTLEIRALYVNPRSWSNGAGRALCQTCYSSGLALGGKMLSLWVLAENHRARKFYESVGFRGETGTSRPYERAGVSLQQCYAPR